MDDIVVFLKSSAGNVKVRVGPVYKYKQDTNV